jgi:pyruvate/2-oxoglutarate dehydrogenase complex dihydrolipoamide acyltransferase (E2) component
VATQILMPKLGLTMTEGTIAEWVASAGAAVKPGDVVMMISTDKVEAEVEADAAGVVFHAAAVGDTLEPGEVVGWLLAEGEEPPVGAAPAAAAPAAAEPAAAPAPDAPAAPTTVTAAEPVAAPAASVATRDAGGRIIASPNARRVAAELAIDLATVAGTGPGGRITADDVIAAQPPGRGLGGRILASPNARRVAAAHGVDVGAVSGTGPGGRVTSEDVEAAVAAGLGPAAAPATAPAAAAAGAPGAAEPRLDRFVPFAAAKAAERLGISIDDVAGTGPDGRVTRQDVYAHARSHGGATRAAAPAGAAAPSVAPGSSVPVTGMRKIIAERMYSSLQESAQLTLTMDVDMDRCVELRDQLKEIGADELGSVPGFTDFVIAACAKALREHPMANSMWAGDTIQTYPDVNIGMAVAVPDGLVVPVIKGADTLGLTDLSIETSRLADAARTKKLSLAEMEGGTFSVTALGMFGVDHFTPVINQPNAAILGVNRIRDDVAWVGDTPRKVKRMAISLTWDHRILDGAPAAEFTQTVKRYLEQPLRLL